MKEKSKKLTTQQESYFREARAINWVEKNRDFADAMIKSKHLTEKVRVLLGLPKKQVADNIIA